MANKFTRIQTTASRYQEAVNAIVPLTMISGQEALTLSIAAQSLIGTDEELIYKYRDEFLHIQKAAENGLTSLRMKIENPNEFAIVARAWGFVCVVESRFETQIVYKKNLNKTSTVLELSNLTIDWGSPTRPLIDIEYYRQSGNLVQLDDSTIVVPIISKIEAVKQELGIATTPGFNIQYSGSGSGAIIPISLFTRGNYGGFPVTQGGTGYRVGDTIIIPGFSLGGTTPLNNAVITVVNIKGKSTISEYSITGLAGAEAGNVNLELLGNGKALVVPSNESRLNGFRVASDGGLIDPNDYYPDAQMVSTYMGSYTNAGFNEDGAYATGAVFQVVASNTGRFGLPYRFYLGPTRPQGRYPVSGVGYNVGDKIVIPGSVVLTGNTTTTDNNIVITVLKVNATGAVLSAKISGTTPNASQGWRISDNNRNNFIRPDVFVDNFNTTFLNGAPDVGKLTLAN
jgi:hypothetical protein